MGVSLEKMMGLANGKVVIVLFLLIIIGHQKIQMIILLKNVWKGIYFKMNILQEEVMISIMLIVFYLQSNAFIKKSVSINLKNI